MHHERERKEERKGERTLEFERSVLRWTYGIPHHAGSVPCQFFPSTCRWLCLQRSSNDRSTSPHLKLNLLYINLGCLRDPLHWNTSRLCRQSGLKIENHGVFTWHNLSHNSLTNVSLGSFSNTVCLPLELTGDLLKLLVLCIPLGKTDMSMPEDAEADRVILRFDDMTWRIDLHGSKLVVSTEIQCTS